MMMARGVGYGQSLKDKPVCQQTSKQTSSKKHLQKEAEMYERLMLNVMAVPIDRPSSNANRGAYKRQNKVLVQ
jgi:hypothetical protein